MENFYNHVKLIEVEVTFGNKLMYTYGLVDLILLTKLLGTNVI